MYPAMEWMFVNTIENYQPYQHSKGRWKKWRFGLFTRYGWIRFPSSWDVASDKKRYSLIIERDDNQPERKAAIGQDMTSDHSLESAGLVLANQHPTQWLNYVKSKKTYHVLRSSATYQSMHLIVRSAANS